MTKRPFDLISLGESVEKHCTQQKRPRLLLYTLDKDVAKSYQFLTQLMPTDDTIVYTSWNLFMNSEYFKGLLDSTMGETAIRTVKVEFLNSMETCVYLEILVNGLKNLSDVPTDSLLNIYRQLDFHLFTNCLPEIKEEIITREYTHNFYRFNKIYKIVDICILADMYIKHAINNNEIYMLVDDELVEVVFTRLSRYDIHTIWSIIRLYPTEILTKHLDRCVIRFNSTRFKSCIIQCGDDPNIMLFIKRVVNCII